MPAAVSNNISVTPMLVTTTSTELTKPTKTELKWPLRENPAKVVKLTSTEPTRKNSKINLNGAYERK